MTGESIGSTRGTHSMWSANSRRLLVAVVAHQDDGRPAAPHLLDVRAHLLPQLVAGGDADHHRARLDQGDGSVLQLTGRITLGPQVGDLLQLERPLQCHRDDRRGARGRRSRGPRRASWATAATSLVRSSTLSRCSGRPSMLVHQAGVSVPDRVPRAWASTRARNSRATIWVDRSWSPRRRSPGPPGCRGRHRPRGPLRSPPRSRPPGSSSRGSAPPGALAGCRRSRRTG